MVSFPIFRRIEVKNYGLFPGSSGDHQLTFDFSPGVSLIVGVNGLGKTTLLTMLLRSLTGPFDLQQTGTPWELGAILNEKPVRLDRETLNFFAQRVADDAYQATMTVTVSFGEYTVRITRQLDTLRLTALEVNSESILLPQGVYDREHEFQASLCQMMALTSFVDVLLVLHYVVFLTERRPGALWDQNAQRQLLRATLLKPDLASGIPALERQVSQTDGEFRRARYEANRLDSRLRNAQAQAKASPAVKSELRATQQRLDADRERLGEIEKEVVDLEEQRREERLRFERAKINREEAEAALERQKYDTLLRLFPSMDEAARLIVTRILTDGECLVCGSDAPSKRRELENQIQEGICPACGSHSLSVEKVVPIKKVESRRLERLLEKAERAATEVEHSSSKLESIIERYDGAVRKAISLRTE